MGIRARWISMLIVVALVGVWGVTAEVAVAEPDNCVSDAGGTWHCFDRYEVAGTGDVVSYGPTECADCPFADANGEASGVFYDGCGSLDHAYWGGSTNRDFPFCYGGVTVTAELDDDIFGNDVAGRFCTDINGDSTYCDTSIGETDMPFCGRSTFSLNLWGYESGVGVFVGGPVTQSTSCPGSSNGVGGVAGHLFLTLEGGPANVMPNPAPGVAPGGCRAWVILTKIEVLKDNEWLEDEYRFEFVTEGQPKVVVRDIDGTNLDVPGGQPDEDAGTSYEIPQASWRGPQLLYLGPSGLAAFGHVTVVATAIEVDGFASEDDREMTSPGPTLQEPCPWPQTERTLTTLNELGPNSVRGEGSEPIEARFTFQIKFF